MAYAGDLKSLALRGVRVRLPPRAPTDLDEFGSINMFRFFVCPWYTLCFMQKERVATPRTHQIRFELFLP
jgi:hypothetical protein